jgi:hypothetical protein
MSCSVGFKAAGRRDTVILIVEELRFDEKKDYRGGFNKNTKLGIIFIMGYYDCSSVGINPENVRKFIDIMHESIKIFETDLDENRLREEFRGEDKEQSFCLLLYRLQHKVYFLGGRY